MNLASLNSHDPCPCGSAREYASCCQPIHLGSTIAPTAEALMRARYSAYVVGKIGFLQETTHPSKLKEFDYKASKEWSEKSEWLGLNIVRTEAGGPTDSKGVVQFEARFRLDGKEQVYSEIASFTRTGTNNQWTFLDGKIPGREPIRRAQPKVGRNDPCPCGSGLKYKKCCEE